MFDKSEKLNMAFTSGFGKKVKNVGRSVYFTPKSSSKVLLENFLKRPSKNRKPVKNWLPFHYFRPPPPMPYVKPHILGSKKMMFCTLIYIGRSVLDLSRRLILLPLL